MIAKRFYRACSLSIIGATENVCALPATFPPSFAWPDWAIAKFDGTVTLGRSNPRPRDLHERQGKSCAWIDRRVRGPHRGEGRYRLAHRLARHPLGGRPFAARSGGDGADLYRGTGLRQAGRRR